MTHIREWWYSNSMKGPGETNDKQNHSICGPDQVACRPWPWRQCVRQLGMQSAHYAYFAYLGPQSQVVTTTSFSSWHVLLHRVNMVHRPRCSLCHLTGGPCPDQGCQSFREACFTLEPFNSRHCLSTRLWSNTWVTSHKYQPINHQFEANQNQSDNLNVLGEF